MALYWGQQRLRRGHDPRAAYSAKLGSSAPELGVASAPSVVSGSCMPPVDETVFLKPTMRLERHQNAADIAPADTTSTQVRMADPASPHDRARLANDSEVPHSIARRGDRHIYTVAAPLRVNLRECLSSAVDLISTLARPRLPLAASTSNPASATRSPRNLSTESIEQPSARR